MDLQHQLQRTLGEGYTLERELAGGGMSRVFVARDRSLDRLVVIKTLASDVAPAISAERFRREIRLAASLQQANIVPVHSTGEVDGVPYYTMPFVEGESLRARLKKDGALPPRVAINILRDVARALAFAHERGVVHRDIKPENILLSGDTAVVTDFGIAKAIEASQSQAGAPTLTHLGTVLGTPAYMAPEQAAGDGSVDHRADLYSLGVVAYELLAGVPPFTDRSAQALMVAHISAVPVGLAERKPDVPVRLSTLVMRCLEKDPARRPGSAVELLQVLDAALLSDRIPAAVTTTAKPSIAVLPFANLSPDPADEFFADGLTDEVITDLAGIHALHVIARTAMMRYKGAGKDLATVARELKVRYVLDGSVRRAADSLRLTARLVDTTDDTTVWSEKISGVVTDIFDMQERVSRTIVDALKVKLTPRESARLALRPIEDLRAYEAYLQAKQAMWSFSPESLERARRVLGEATNRIGENPRVIAALGFVHIHAISSGGPDAGKHAAAAEQCARRLGDLDPESFGRYALAGVLHWRRGEMREAIETLSQAHELEPNDPDVVAYLQYAHLMAGQDERARELSRLLVSLDPITPLFQTMPAFCDLLAGRAQEVLQVYERFLDRESENPLAHFWMTSIYAEAGEDAGMQRVAAETALRWPESPFGVIARVVLDLLGRPTADRSAVALPPQVRELTSNSESVARSLMWIFGRLGAADAAFDALEDAVRRGFAHYPHLARHSSALSGLREHPRFRRILDVVRERWERGGTSAADLVAPSVAAPVVKREGRPVIAVLPLTNMSASVDDEYFADGVTEDIIAQLSQIASLRVISRASVMGYRNSTRRRREIAGELGASHVIEGSVRRAGLRVRIVAQLLDAGTETHLWSETFDRDLTDIFAIQSELAQRIAAALVAKLTPAEERRLARAPTRDARAYDLYLIGRQLFSRRTPDSLRAAISHFEQAIERDSTFAGAYAGLADAYVFAGLGYAPLPVHEAFAKAKDAASRAVALDDASPEVLCAVGISAMHGDWDLVRARTAFERALTISPSHAAAHQMLGWCTFAVGDYAGAVGPLRRARELDPLNVSLIVEEAWPYMYAELFDIAIDYFRRAVEIDPGFGLGHYNLGAALEGLGRHAEALDAFQRAVDCMGSTPWVLASIARTTNALGHPEKSDEVLATLHEQGRAGVAVWLSIAMVLDALGRAEEAADALERSIDAHEPFVWGLGLEAWLRFPNARKLTRFQAILDRVGAKPHNVSRQRELLLQLRGRG